MNRIFYFKNTVFLNRLIESPLLILLENHIKPFKMFGLLYTLTVTWQITLSRKHNF